MVESRSILMGRLTLLLILTACGVMGDFPPIWEQDMNNHVIPEDSPIGTSIYTLKGSDPEGGEVRYGIAGTNKLSVDPVTGVVKVARVLDREANDTLRLYVTLEDNIGRNDNNVVPLPISIIILDVNDNSPHFTNAPYTTTIPEDTTVGTTIFPKITVSDLDVVGDIINITCETTLQFADSCTVFGLDTIRDSATHYLGALKLNTKLDYASRQIYQFKLIAQDGKHQSSAAVVIRVADVQNSPPEFKGSMTGLVREDDPVGTLVTRIKAQDGDRGDPRNIVYKLLDTLEDHFSLDANTGELRTAKPLDRESLAPGTSVISLTVKATEVVQGKPLSSPETEIVGNVTVTIRDVNDEPPRFNQREFHTHVEENVPDRTPLSNLDIQVSDTDIGNNSIFSLDLVDPSGMFSIEPQVASGHTSVSIQVKTGPLDYENPNHRKFILLVVAKEKQTSRQLQSTATVTVSVMDVNDNKPYFDRQQYSALLAETATPGTIVTSIAASDRDTGVYGKQGIVYSLLGNGAEKFTVNKQSGLITVALCSQPGSGECLDYEANPTYFLSFQATDSEGSGHSSQVPIRIELQDSNDNAPRFTHTVYPAVIDEGSATFDPILQVKAEDADQTSELTYAILEGIGSDLFNIHPRQGIITVKDANGLDVSGIPNNLITLSVQVSDGQFSDTSTVRIDVKDANNNSPKFEKETYLLSVMENSPPGSQIEMVMATDADIGENADITYRIKSGAFQNFAVDADSGIVTVSGKLDYDTRKSYDIHVLAIDGGTPSLTGTTTLTISIVDNNDKAPFFTPPTQRAQVPENAEIGHVFYKLKAEDPDVASPEALKYKIQEPITAVDKEGNEIEDGDRSYKDFFTLNEDTGAMSVVAPLDRNVAAWVFLPVIVTDTSADALQTSQGMLSVTIVDVNDFPPMFVAPWTVDHPIIPITVKEERPIGATVYTFMATDEDSNIAAYQMDTVTEYFTLNSSTGDLQTAMRIDYEEVKHINFAIKVLDTGLPQMSATATVQVTVVNINDEVPVFNETQYRMSVSEGAPKGTLIGEVFATDKDEGRFGEVKYCMASTVAEIQSKSACHQEQRGLIYVNDTSMLDREKHPYYELFVKAIDGGSWPDETNTAVVKETPPCRRFTQEYPRKRELSIPSDDLSKRNRTYKEDLNY